MGALSNKRRELTRRCILFGFCVAAAACSESEPRTVLFTNALGLDYVVLALDDGDTARVDTLLYVPSGTQVCWPLSDVKPLPFTIVLDSYDVFGTALARTTIEPRLASWTWGGSGPDAKGAPVC